MPADKRPTLSYVFGKGTGPAQVIALDAVLSEKHTRASDVTEHPVERGAPVSDHSRPKQPGLALEAMVSNHQLALSQDEQEPAGTRVPRILADLQRMQEQGTLVTYQSSRTTLQNALVTQLDYTLDSTAEALRFSLTLKVIRLVETRTVAIRRRRAQPKGDPLKDEGPKPTEKADQPYESLLYSFSDTKVGGFLTGRTQVEGAAFLLGPN